ncbi:DICT sensory domain-containing protein [Halorussus sp. AFM4]|uniref:DICT sensory domain-containing protein n=1 Tax=Halorussus sp. AFM4 TaxID=3421651 RepID=UPI003EBC6768
MTLSSIIADLRGSEQTLTLYNAGDDAAVRAVRDHFAVQNVAVREADAPAGPDGFAVLHDGGEFVAASDLDELRRSVSFEADLLDAPDFAEASPPDVLKHVSNTTFSTYDRRRMILASREIEERAWRTAGGELHAGFQALSRFREQWELYARIAHRGVDVHAYGVPDWRPPEPDWLTVRAEDTPELRESWFVVFDAPDGEDCALVAEERGPGEFAGFWTYDDEIVGDALAHLRSTYP